MRKETPQLTGRGQPLGELGTGKALDEAAFSLPEKALSDPVRAASGWAVLRVLEKKTADPAELAGEREQVAASLREQKRVGAVPGLPGRRARALSRSPATPKAYRRALGEEQ